MAFIYIQEIENKNLRDRIDLLDFKSEIEKIIGDFFNIDYRNILKSIEIVRDCFKYSLHLAVNNSILIDINKRVEYFLQEKIGEDIKFRNRKVTYIGFIQEEYIGETIDRVSSIEIIGYKELYLRDFTLKDLIGLDTFTLRFKDRGLDYFFQNNEGLDRIEEDRRFIIIEGTIGNNQNYPKLTSFPDSKFIENFREEDRKIYGYENFIVRNFNIDSIRWPNKEEELKLDSLRENIKKILGDRIASGKKEKKERVGSGEVIDSLKIYDVGQAMMLETLNNKRTAYYIDLGMDKGVDILNYKKTININRDKKVILTHIHLDHWHILNLDINAYKQDWYIPRQEKGFIFSKRCGEILSYGKKISYILEDREIDSGRIYIGQEFKDLKASHKHETGLYIVLKIRGKKILIAGDQRYEFMNELACKNIDILLASHHGGDYTKLEAGEGIEYIPRPNNLNSLVVYSYGRNNPYNHPDKISDYRKLGWINEYHTVDGSYTF